MAILISARGVCQSRMTRGEERQSDRLLALHFHRRNHRQRATNGQVLPPQCSGIFDELVTHAIHTAVRCQMPDGQYPAVMIDEAHDFALEWHKLVTQMVDPTTNSLLVLVDDAQSIYERRTSRDGSKQFSFKSVGIQAQGRTTILKINYRNTRQILQTASLVAAKHLSPHAPRLRGSLPPTGADPAWGGPAPDRLLTADDENDDAGLGDGIPLLKPVSCGREGQAPVIIKLPTLRDEAFAIADHLASAHKEGQAWGDMAVLCANWKTMELCASASAQRKLPHRVRKKSGEYRPGADAIQVMTMKVSKGLEFPVVALPGVGHMPAAGEDEKDAARVFYVAARRAT